LESVLNGPLSYGDISRRHNASSMPTQSSPVHLSQEEEDGILAMKNFYGGVVFVCLTMSGGLLLLSGFSFRLPFILIEAILFGLGLFLLTLFFYEVKKFKEMNRLHARDVTWLQNALPTAIRGRLNNVPQAAESLLRSQNGFLGTTALTEELSLGLDITGTEPKLFVYSEHIRQDHDKSMVHGFITLGLDNTY